MALDIKHSYPFWKPIKHSYPSWYFSWCLYPACFVLSIREVVSSEKKSVKTEVFVLWWTYVTWRWEDWNLRNRDIQIWIKTLGKNKDFWKHKKHVWCWRWGWLVLGIIFRFHVNFGGCMSILDWDMNLSYVILLRTRPCFPVPVENEVIHTHYDWYSYTLNL